MRVHVERSLNWKEIICYIFWDIRMHESLTYQNTIHFVISFPAIREVSDSTNLVRIIKFTRMSVNRLYIVKRSFETIDRKHRDPDSDFLGIPHYRTVLLSFSGGAGYYYQTTPTIHQWSALLLCIYKYRSNIFYSFFLLLFNEYWTQIFQKLTIFNKRKNLDLFLF